MRKDRYSFKDFYQWQNPNDRRPYPPLLFYKNQLLIFTKPNTIQILNAQTCQSENSIEETLGNANSNHLSDFQVVKDKLITSERQGQITIRNFKTLQIEKKIVNNATRIAIRRFRIAGNLLAAISPSQPEVHIFDLEAGTHSNTFIKTGAHFSFSDLVVYNDLIIASNLDGTITCFNKDTGDMQLFEVDFPGSENRTQTDSSNGFSCLTIYENRLYAGLYDERVLVYDLDKMQLEDGFFQNESAVFCLQVVNQKLFTGARDGKIRIFDCKTKQLLQTLDTTHECPITHLQIVNEKIYAISKDSQIFVWDFLKQDIPSTVPATDCVII